MKFSDLKNPAAAAAVIKNFKDRFSAKVCLSPTGGCSPDIISAHTLSVGSMLRPISRDGQVYTVNYDFYNNMPNGPADIGLRVLSKTSVFNGFCSIHDKSLFASIEDKPFLCTPEQLFTHAYRAIAKESYLKRKQAESLPTPEEVHKIHGLQADEKLEFSSDAQLFQFASLRGAEEIERRKMEIDQYLVSSEWWHVKTKVIPFRKIPTTVCNFVYAPDEDFAGKQLQDFENWEADLSPLMLTITPAPSGGYQGFALLSYFDTQSSAPRQLIDSLLNQPDITSSLLWLVFSKAENYAISPTWYDSLTDVQRRVIMEAFQSNSDMFGDSANRLCDCRLAVDSWEPQTAFDI